MFNAITREAQNALLKVFEEPTENTHFFLITHSSASLLPTLKSRLSIQTITTDEENNGALAEKFIKETAAGRLKLLKKIIDSDTAKSEAIQFISDLESVIAEKVHANPILDNEVQELYRVKSYLHDTSASVKMLLEHLSLVLPRM